MEKIINSYESMFIVSLANGEEAAKATVNKFTGLIAANAEVIQIDEWGKRRLAYPIEDMNDGYYTVATFKSEGAFPAELQRLMTIDESVMRVMVIKLDHEPVLKATEAPAEEAAAEAVVEEAPATDAE
jgi:small subunit ribosomal protein S6